MRTVLFPVPVLASAAVNAAMAALLGALGCRGSGPAVLERLLHAPGAAIGARLVHMSSHQRNAEQAAEADGMDVTQMDSGTLQVRQCWASAVAQHQCAPPELCRGHALAELGGADVPACGDV